MSNLFDQLQPAVKKETKNVAITCAIGSVIMWIAFFVLHLVLKGKVSFDYTVILGGIFGSLIAVLNFLLMGIAVQKIATMNDEDDARKKMKASYSTRFMIQVVWCVLAIIAPCFHMAAGILPLLFPGIGIKLRGITGKV